MNENMENIMPEEEADTLEVAVDEKKTRTSRKDLRHAVSLLRRDIYIHRFKKPYEYEGKEYKDMEFNFAKLTGQDMIDIEIEMAQRGEYAISPEHSRLFQCYLASKASGVGSDVITHMPLNDFTQITNAVRNFLLG